MNGSFTKAIQMVLAQRKEHDNFDHYDDNSYFESKAVKKMLHHSTFPLETISKNIGCFFIAVVFEHVRMKCDRASSKLKVFGRHGCLNIHAILESLELQEIRQYVL